MLCTPVKVDKLPLSVILYLKMIKLWLLYYVLFIEYFIVIIIF